MKYTLPTIVHHDGEEDYFWKNIQVNEWSVLSC